MADNEKLSIRKFAGSFFQWMPWVKNARFIIGAAIVLFVGVTIWRAYFRKDVQQTQNQAVTQTITAQPGSTVNVEAPSQTQEAPKDKKIEPFVGLVATVGKGGEYQVGGFVGIKF